MIEANEQKNESLEFVNPADSCAAAAHILVPPLLAGNGRHGSVAGEHDGFSRQGQQLALDSRDERFFVATEKVAAATAPRKKDIACEQERRNVFLAVHGSRLFAVEREPAGGVPCHMDDLPLDNKAP